jgi:hypothetical protein
MMMMVFIEDPSASAARSGRAAVAQRFDCGDRPLADGPMKAGLIPKARTDRSFIDSS